MATIDNLVSIYRNVHRLPANSDLPANAWTQLTLMAQGIDIARGGQQAGDIWTYASAVSWIHDSAKTTTEVAVMTYGFLTDLTLGTSGIDYLVSPTGGNPNNLNSEYYAKFSLENRFINFAINLAQSQVTNLAAAESRIRDADLAQESANLTKSQILLQAGIAALSQANSAPQQVLALLRA